VRLLRFDLLAYGPFTDRSLDLGGDPGVLHVVYGHNGAGKSSALRALVALLFEVETRTTDDHLHPMPKLRIGALVDPGDGTKLEVIRRKGRKDTLRGSDDAPLGFDPFAQATGGLDKALFQMMFALDHARLREGGKRLSRGDEDLAESLFGAGLGRDVHDVLTHLNSAADAIFSARGSKPPLNAALRRHKEAKKEVRTAQLRPKEWTQASKALADLEDEGKRLDAELRDLDQQRTRLERLRQLLPLVDGHDATVARRAELGEVVVLPADARDERKAAQDVLRRADQRTKKLATEIAELEQEVGQLSVPAALVARAQTIKALGLQLGAEQKAATDRNLLSVRIAQTRTEAERVLTGLGHDPDLAQVDALLVETVRQKRIRELASRRKVLESEERSAKENREEATRKLERARRQLADLPEARAVGALAAALEATRAAGDLEAQIARSAKGALRGRAEEQLAALGLWAGALDDAPRLPLPPTETIDRFEIRWKAREKETTLLDERRRELDEEVVRIESEIAEMDREGEVITEAGLAAARDGREATWGAVRRSWLEGADAPEGDATLAGRYEETVEAADEAADQLRAKADRAARYSQLLATREAASRRRADLEEAHNKLATRASADTSEWNAAWEASGVKPRPPGEMRPWLVRHGQLVEAIQTARDAQQEHDALRERAEGLAGRLRAHLAELKQPVGAESTNELMRRAEAIVDSERKTADERRHLGEQATTLASELERTQEAEQRAGAALETWAADWGSATEGLRLREGASPGEAEAFLDEVALLRKQRDDERGFRVRIDGIDKGAREFGEKVGAVCGECAPDLVERPADEATEALLERLRRGEKDEAARVKVVGQLEKRRSDRSSAEVEHSDATAKLEELLASAGCADVTALEQAEERSAQVRALDAKLQEQREQIRIVGAGKDVDALRADAAEIDRDALPAELDELGRRIDTLREAHHEHLTAVGQQSEALAAMDTGAQAAFASTRAQQALAEIREKARIHARFKLAAHLLEREVRSYREQNQGPLLARAGELFSRLTVGVFRALAVDFDEHGDPVLRCVRADDAHVEPKMLSDGEADQLYLALRVASLEQHLERNAPVPFVADDLFVNFDDDRARAGLQVLGELAKHTQVLFFTHHARLVELAREVLTDATLRVFEL